MIDYPNIAMRIVACSLCGAILVVSANGLICQNRNCPYYMLESHEHLSENGDPGIIYLVGPAGPSGAATVSTSGTYGFTGYTGTNKGGGS
jgi:hypothetical protein